MVVLRFEDAVYIWHWGERPGAVKILVLKVTSPHQQPYMFNLSFVSSELALKLSLVLLSLLLLSLELRNEFCLPVRPFPYISTTTYRITFIFNTVLPRVIGRKTSKIKFLLPFFLLWGVHFSSRTPSFG